MRLPVYIHEALGSESTVTNITHVWLLRQMGFFVDIQQAALPKCFVALFTFEGPFSRVRTFMCLHGCRLYEPLPTHRTFERLLTWKQ